MDHYSLRHYIDLIEARDDPWGVTPLAPFAPSVEEFKKTVPDIGERINRFLAVKQPNPLMIRYSKHDRPMNSNSIMAGFQHCHLTPDCLLLYTLKGHALNLVALVQHADIEGKRAKATAKRLAPYRG